MARPEVPRVSDTVRGVAARSDPRQSARELGDRHGTRVYRIGMLCRVARVVWLGAVALSGCAVVTGLGFQLLATSGAARRGRLSDEQVDGAIASLAERHDNEMMARWMVKFLRGAQGW